MPNYKLIYFNGRGRMEPVRLMFALKGEKYEDFRIERADWPKYKEQMPFGQVPVLEVDGKKLSQSNAIYQYIAKQFGFNGKDDWEAAKIQELLGSINDIFGHLAPMWAIEDPEKKKAFLAKAAEEHLTPYLTKLQKRLEENGHGHFVGNSLTIADLALYQVFDGFEKMMAPGLLAKFPKLVDFHKKIEELPKVKEWIEKRPKTEF